MKLVKPSYTILSKLDSCEILKSIERAGRTAYKSEDKITDVSAEEFIKMLISKGHESVLEHETLSVLFICDRGVSHEIVRHRIASYTQESTRYCNYSNDKFDNQLTFIIPSWIPDVKAGDYNCEPTMLTWLIAMEQVEKSYNQLIKLGWQPQQARTVLPNSLKTEIVVTANIREWRTIFKQRTSKSAHPQMRELMIPLLIELQGIIPVLFDDLLENKTI